MGRPVVRILGSEGSACLQQRFVLPQLILDDRFADKRLRLNRIEFARLNHSSSCLGNLTVGCGVNPVLRVSPGKAWAEFHSSQVLSLGNLPVPVILLAYPGQDQVSFA